jgi:micrococcal nuclease
LRSFRVQVDVGRWLWIGGAAAVVAAGAGAWLLAGAGGPGGGEPTPGGHAVRARVVRVVDGDTIVAAVEGQDQYVRYIGVDTPETVKPDTPVQCYGPQASEENHRLVEGATVRLVFDRERRDPYGRLLAYVYRGARFVNARLVRRGYARSMTIPPNTARVRLFHRLQARAGEAGRGLWGRC